MVFIACLISVDQPVQDDKASIRCETSPPSTPRSSRLNRGGHAASHEDIRDIRRYSHDKEELYQESTVSLEYNNTTHFELLLSPLHYLGSKYQAAGLYIDAR